jgi:tetratricopeptide (TPR) repeat protein
MIRLGLILTTLWLAVGLAGCDLSDNAAETTASTRDLPELAPVGATLLDGLGDHHMPISTENEMVQRWFDQGLMLTYGFNHEAAERSFLKALEIEPECAMCWWGAALVLGPNINAPMDPDSNAAALERAAAASRLAANASEREQAYIQALNERYRDPAPEDRSALDEAFADAMAGLVEAYPDDLDALTLYAESLMTMQAWDYWHDDGTTPKGNTARILASLDKVMESDPEHPGALHLYIHAVEASDGETLRRGEWAADQLRDLIPGSGHLVHMPSHIYARVGRWRDAAAVNRDAIRADDLYLAICRPQPGVYPLGYVPHNHHFLWFVSSMIGDRATALAAAESTSERTSDPDLMRAPGFEAMQNFAFTPVFAKVRFGLWDDIAATPKPDQDLPYMIALWHYAQGLAAVRQDRLDDAREHDRSLKTLAADPAFEEMLWFGRYPLSLGVGVAERMLAAELALAEGQTDQAITILRQAASQEDRIPYDEPPGWHQPVRQVLGAVLLEAGQPEQAETIYREELRRNPENGWSLFGLGQALKAQERADEAATVQARFEQAWGDADVTLAASRY